MPTAPTEPTTQSIMRQALEELGVLGAGNPDPSGEDTVYVLARYNRVIGQANTRRRNAFYKSYQEFTFSVARQSYTIGTSANSANFVITAGERPVKLEAAQLVLADSSPDVLLPLGIVNVDLYTQIPIPALASSYPHTLYYAAEWPNGRIYPYPAFPTQTSYQLRLWWWNQLLRIHIDDITATVQLPPGYEHWLVLATAIACYPGFPKRTNLEELKRQERMARADMQSLNTSPPAQSSTDGIQQGGTGDNFSWRSRTWV